MRREYIAAVEMRGAEHGARSAGSRTPHSTLRIPSPAGRLDVVGVMALLVVTAGCAAGGRTAPRWQPLARFGDVEDMPRIVVYGNLAGVLPRFDPTPALDEFLYGPTEPQAPLLRNPQGMAMLDGVLLVCDQGHPDIIGIDLASGRSATWQDEDHRPRCPVAITVGQDGNVYVADTTLRSVLVYLPTGGFVGQLTPSTDPNRRFRPCSLLMSDGILYVGNLGDHRIDRWHVGTRQWMPPIPPPASGPGPVAPTGMCITHKNVLLIADSIQSRVLRFSVADGQWLTPIGAPGRQQGEFVRPKQICRTPSGVICVTDAGRQSVVVLDVDGAYLTEIHEWEKAWRGFTLPAGLLALPADGLAMLMTDGRPAPDPRPDEWVLVSDSLSASSLNLLGVFLPHREEATTHAGP